MAIGSVRYGQLNRSFVYSYTPQGNISAVCDGDRQSTYQYDEINQLIRENNAYLNKTVTYSYDAGGNILTKTIYPYTTGSTTKTVGASPGATAVAWPRQPKTASSSALFTMNRACAPKKRWTV